MKRYKVWIEIEEIDDDAETFERVEWPLCIRDTATLREAVLCRNGIALALGQGLDPDEIAHFVSADWRTVDEEAQV